VPDDYDDEYDYGDPLVCEACGEEYCPEGYPRIPRSLWGQRDPESEGV
jgi:hypothetical protein